MIPDIKDIEKHPEVYAKLLQMSLKAFITVFHYYIYRKPFNFMPFHEEIIKKLENIVYGKAEKKNLYIGLAPRFGKSAIMQYLITWGYAINPNCNYIMTSYGDKLVLKFSGIAKSIIESDLYYKLFGLKCVKDTTAKDLWKIEQGGEFRAVSMKGIITGFGCFNYNQPVITEKGEMLLGDIVEKQEKVRVYSYNHKKSQFELKNINFYIKNKDQEFVRVLFNDGSSVICTPDHKFYTDKGYVEAKDLIKRNSILPSNSLNNVNRYSKFFAYILIGMIFVCDILRFGICKEFLSWISIMATSLKSYSLRFFRPVNSSLNIGNLCVRYVKILCNKFVGSSICRNLLCLFYGYFVVPVMSTVKNTISFVVGLRPIRKIFNPVIGAVSVKMSREHSFFLRTYKRMRNKLVNSAFMPNAIYTKINTFISFFVRIFRKNMIGSVVFNDATPVNRIKSFKFWNRKPLIVYSLGHNFTSYCLNVSSNHNMLLGGNQQVLVSNCGQHESGWGGALIIDDYLKADNFNSEVEKQNCVDVYTNTLKSRRNNPNTPIICIAQRLATDDLVGWLKANEAEDWDFFSLPTLNEEDKSIWEAIVPSKDLIKMRETNPFLFYSQYQQEPIILGGSVIKEDWFRFYPSVEVDYKRMFMTADTALKVKECNDYTAIALWGITTHNELYLIDMLHGKWEAPDLERQFISFWNKWRKGIGITKPNSVYIEDKASGTGLIQSIKRQGGVPVIAYEPEKDKLTRVMDVTPYIESGCLYLPIGKEYQISKDLLSECVAFTADDSHAHDDMVDCMTMALNIAYRKSPMKVADDVAEQIQSYSMY
jgi:predicted phage terminase large subunit-like protein